MKTLIKILCLSSLCLGQLILSDEQLASMSNTEKTMLYQVESKSPISAVALNFWLPTAGYAYINDWKRGVPFLGAEISLCALAYSNRNEGSTGNLVLVGAAIALKLYESIDVYKQTNKYNQKLYNTLFGKSNKKNLSFLILPANDGGYLNLSYKF